MSSSRRTSTAEFKQEAVLLVTQQGLSLAEAARRLGIPANLLRTWTRFFETIGPPGTEHGTLLPLIRKEWNPEKEWTCDGAPLSDRLDDIVAIGDAASGDGGTLQAKALLRACPKMPVSTRALVRVVPVPRKKLTSFRVSRQLVRVPAEGGREQRGEIRGQAFSRGRGEVAETVAIPITVLPSRERSWPADAGKRTETFASWHESNNGIL
jgi:hypothetical protein